MADLAVIVAVGPLRERARRCVDAVLAQSAADRIEAIVVDLAPASAEPLGVDERHVRIIDLAEGTWGEARSVGVRASSAPIVAFLEDHCVAQPGWAEAVLRAYEGPWDAVGFAFVNANPRTYTSRASLMTDYGRWLAPARREESHYLPSNNVSYRRSALAGLEDELATTFSLDFNLHEHLARSGARLLVEPDARVAHENFESVLGLMRANHDFCRLMAANRVVAGSWGMPRRALYGAAAPLAAPALKLARLAWSLRGRGQWRAFAASAPVVAATFAWAAIGESAGYLSADADQEAMRHWEVAAPRASE